jgi:hypothetical protein
MQEHPQRIGLVAGGGEHDASHRLLPIDLEQSGRHRIQHLLALVPQPVVESMLPDARRPRSG